MTDFAPLGSARHRTVLTELVDVFCVEGFATVSLGELATRLRCSKSTLYAIAPSKEQLIAAVVREFFRVATERVEEAVAGEDEPTAAIGAYLRAIAVQLEVPSTAFFVDLDAFAPAREIYVRNTVAAARRVRGLVDAAAAERPGVDARFLGFVAGQVMEAINLGRATAATGLDHAAAYGALADLITAGAAGRPEGTTA